MTIKLLSKSIHSDLKLGGFDLKVFSDIPSIPIYINEIKHLACDHPLFFHNNKETYELRLLCSLNSPNGSAWITDEGKWVGNYVPAFLRHQPFSAHPTGVGEEVGIFIDDASPRFNDKGSLLFENSEPTNLLNMIISSMKQIYAIGRTTQQALDCLSTFNLVKPWEARIKMEDSEEVMFEGLHCIDEEALNELTADQLRELNDVSALSLIYGQLFSMGNLCKLVSLQNLKSDRSLGSSMNTLGNQIDFEDGSTEELLNFDNL